MSPCGHSSVIYPSEKWDGGVRTSRCSEKARLTLYDDLQIDYLPLSLPPNVFDYVPLILGSEHIGSSKGKRNQMATRHAVEHVASYCCC